jgi:TetR/AcrR family transcriptional repressor of nem operon
MVRSREFDEDEVLERAMEAFWLRGYRATTLEQLLEAMQLSKSSFYATFGSKKDVLLTALRRYADSAMGGLVAPLLRPQAGRAEIEETLERLVRHARSRDGARGCLVNNCLGEVAPHEPDVRVAVRTILAALEARLVEIVSRAQEAGEITRDESPRTIARFLATTFGAINMAAKARPTRGELDDVVHMALRALGPVPPAKPAAARRSS